VYARYDTSRVGKTAIDLFGRDIESDEEKGLDAGGRSPHCVVDGDIHAYKLIYS
jgi:hypothetical protein